MGFVTTPSFFGYSDHLREEKDGVYYREIKKKIKDYIWKS